MNKFKAFFKKFGSTLYEWFIASDRWLHIGAGWCIFIVMAFAIGLPMGMAIMPAPVFIGAYVATLIAMLSVEFKDKMKGGIFDWKDVNAGMVLGNIMMILWLILSLI